MDWYIAENGVKEGPYAGPQIRSLLQAGSQGSEHVAWRFEVGGWTIEQIPELQRSAFPSRTVKAHGKYAPIGHGSPNPKRVTYCGRYWRGELPLPASYWINGTLLGLAPVGLIIALGSNDFANQAPRWFSAGGLAFWLLLVILTPWKLVGIWRSARHYLAAGESKYWGRLTQSMVVFEIFLSTFNLATAGVPQTIEFAQLALGIDPLGSYELRLSRDGTELKISGAIVFGLTEKAAMALDAYPKVEIIHLNSQGGRVGEARRLRDFIASRGLTTFTSGACFSACTLAYAGGKQRLIGKNASIGFHQYCFPGVHPKVFRRQQERDKQDWLARGIDRAFIDRAYAAPHDGLWRPGHQELLAAHFVTGYAAGDEPATSVHVRKN